LFFRTELRPYFGRCCLLRYMSMLLSQCFSTSWPTRESHSLLLTQSPLLNKYNPNELDLNFSKWGDIDWIQLAQDREQWMALVYTVMKRQLS
jgi:hypothetical protein